MQRTEHGISVVTAAAIAFGAAKSTDIIKDILRGQGFGKIPESAKSITATLVAVAGSSLVETGWKRRLLTSCTAAGLASIVHNGERTVRARGDLERITALNAVGRQR